MPNPFYTYQSIDPAECIGDSVYKIRNNDFNASEAIGDLNTLIGSLSAALNAANLALTLAVSAAAPVGAVQTFATSTAPVGWLECNGVTVPNGVDTIQGKTANFSALHAAVGSTYGAPGRLPDLRGEFVRGWDNSRGIDSGRTFGSSQNATRVLKDWFAINLGRDAIGNGGLQDAAADWETDSVTRVYNAFETGFGGTNIGSFRMITDGMRVRPRNIALLYCVKY